MRQGISNVLFLCTGNSARSILAEGILNARGAGRFRAYSAGSHPTGRVNPLALETLRAHNIEPCGARSKRWDEFAKLGAPDIHFVITVCDNAAGEVCPFWPGGPISAHWGIEDPAAATASDEAKRKAFEHAYAQLLDRINDFLALRLEGLDSKQIKAAVDAIGDRKKTKSSTA